MAQETSSEQLKKHSPTVVIEATDTDYRLYIEDYGESRELRETEIVVTEDDERIIVSGRLLRDLKRGYPQSVIDVSLVEEAAVSIDWEYIEPLLPECDED